MSEAHNLLWALVLWAAIAAGIAVHFIRANENPKAAIAVGFTLLLGAGAAWLAGGLTALGALI